MKNTFTTLHHQYCERVNHVVDEYIQHLPPSLLRDAMVYSLLAGGKRIRPFLIYAVGQMFDCQLNMLDAPAAAIETIHTYSLIHDDLPAMDDDNLRRGIPTCHIKYGEATAILAGDALQTYAFSLLAQAPYLTDSCKINLVNELAQASGAEGMCLGQLLDLTAEHNMISLEELNNIHVHKTGALIKAAVRFGMFVAGDKAMQYENALNNYADHIGLAFQIQDDILDVIGDQQIMGKHQGTDKQAEKNTYATLLGLERSLEKTKELYQLALEELNKIPYNSDPLRQLAGFIIDRKN